MITVGDDTATFASALAAALHDSPRTIREVAEDLDWTSDYLAKITRGERTPRPSGVFALERALGLAAGELSRHLGYIPADAPASVVAAVQADPRLTDNAKRMILATYRAGLRG